MKAQPRDDISCPLMQPEPWLWRRRSTGETIAVIAKTWFAARERAPLEYVERFGGGVPPDDLELVCNPVKQLELARTMAAKLDANQVFVPASTFTASRDITIDDTNAVNPVRIVLRADCNEVREALEDGRREVAAVPVNGLRVNGSAPKWGEGFDTTEDPK